AALENDCNASSHFPANCCSIAMPYWCTASRLLAAKLPWVAASWTDSGVVSPSALRMGAASLGTSRSTSSLVVGLESALARVLPVTASIACTDKVYPPLRLLRDPVTIAFTPWLTATNRADCSSSLLVGLGS